MATFLLFVLATLGLTNILVHGKIMDNLGIRPWLKKNLSDDWYELFECYECSGWWAGLFMGLLLISINPLVFIPCAFAGALLGHFYSAIYYLIQSKTEFEVPEDEPEQEDNAVL